jgi:predicted nucleic acid-binding protein
MRLLIDTNVFLEIILEQENAGQAKDLLQRTHEHELFITDYSLHSIGLLLFRRKRYGVFRSFLRDLAIRAGMTVISISLDRMEAVIDVAQKFSLDFDDAYQYAAAEEQGLILVSFDADFDRTAVGRKTPAAILNQ